VLVILLNKLPRDLSSRSLRFFNARRTLSAVCDFCQK